jgi:diguanylate cyclase (GGDEF)-like protein
MESRSWLLPNGIDRERMLDMDRRLEPLRRKSFAVLFLALVAMAPWIGWWTLAPCLVTVLLPRIIAPWATRSEHPEYALFAAWMCTELVIAGSVAISGGAGEPTMAWLAIPIATLCTRFSSRGIAVGVAWALFLLLAVAFGVDPHGAIAYPPNVIAPAAVIVTVAIFGAALMQSDLEHRKGAIIDPLTGLLNRLALERRIPELAQQAAYTGEPVGAILGDIDHFKDVNDTFGHVAGDGVLRDLSAVLRDNLRAFDLAYRVGGEEFLVLLPGADLAQAAEVGENLRRAVETAPLGDGRQVTMSFGIAASRPGEGFDYDAVFAAADTALYVAKRSGRNRVCADSDADRDVPALAA